VAWEVVRDKDNSVVAFRIPPREGRCRRRDHLERVAVGDIVLEADRAVVELFGGQRSMTAMFAEPGDQR
jgi:hypothetical protein